MAKLYRDLHEHPELSFHETKTAGKVAKRLRELGDDVTTGIGGTGVVGMLRNGPVIEPTLSTGVQALTAAALAWLGPTGNRAQSTNGARRT